MISKEFPNFMYLSNLESESDEVTNTGCGLFGVWLPAAALSCGVWDVLAAEVREFTDCRNKQKGPCNSCYFFVSKTKTT